jgi:hypothetical protein
MMRLVGWALIAAGLVAAVAGWIGVRSSPGLLDQLTYLATGGLAGGFLILLGAAFLGATNIATVGAALHRAEKHLDDREDRP